MLTDRIAEQYAEHGDNALVTYPIRFVFALRQSFFLSLTFLGVLVLAYGATVADGVIAGMMGIWGGTLVIVGGCVYGLMWVVRYVLRERKKAADASRAAGGGDG